MKRQNVLRHFVAGDSIIALLRNLQLTIMITLLLFISMYTRTCLENRIHFQQTGYFKLIIR